MISKMARNEKYIYNEFADDTVSGTGRR